MVRLICINGRGSSGKDTQAEIIEAKRYFPAPIKRSSGEMVRSALENEGEFAMFHKLIASQKEESNSGGFIDDRSITAMITTILFEDIENGYQTHLITGFPRTIPQLESLDDWIIQLENNQIKVDVEHLCFNVEPDTSRSRAAHRREKGIFRPDDDPVRVERRLSEFEKLTEPMLARLAGEGRLTIINGQFSMEKVRQVTEEHFDMRALNPEGRSLGRPERK